MPGPGTYQQSSLESTVRQKIKGKNGVFGSTERRFVQLEKLKTPGPCEYVI